MKFTKGMSIGAIVLGCICLGISYYIQAEVDSGRVKLHNAEQSLQRGRTLFSLTPATDQIGQQIQRSADKKIGEAKQEINYYTALAGLLSLGGYILIIAGIISLVLIWRRNQKNR